MAALFALSNPRAWQARLVLRAMVAGRRLAAHQHQTRPTALSHQPPSSSPRSASNWGLVIPAQEYLCQFHDEVGSGLPGRSGRRRLRQRFPAVPADPRGRGVILEPHAEDLTPPRLRSTPAPVPRAFYLGLRPGQAIDPTAVVVVERLADSPGGKKPILHAGHLERLPLDTPYPGHHPACPPAARAGAVPRPRRAGAGSDRGGPPGRRPVRGRRAAPCEGQHYRRQRGNGR